MLSAKAKWAQGIGAGGSAWRTFAMALAF